MKEYIFEWDNGRTVTLNYININFAIRQARINGAQKIYRRYNESGYYRALVWQYNNTIKKSHQRYNWVAEGF